MAVATPSGPVEAGAFERLYQMLEDALPPADGLLLALHGAMFCEAFPDADGEIVSRLRQRLGADYPIVVTHDFHANISNRMAGDSTALVVYQTNPHVDQRSRGLLAAQIMARTVRGEIRPVQTIARPPMICPIMGQNTSRQPLKSILARAVEMERTALAVSVAGGYQYADVEECGPAVVAVTDNDGSRAAAITRELSERLWQSRELLEARLPDARESVRMALTSDVAPVVLVDIGDNIGGGSPGDSTILLSELLAQRAQGWVMVIRAAVDALVVGAHVSLRVGDPPVPVSGRVRSLHEGTFVEPEVRHGGARYNDQGLTAVLEVGGPNPDCPNLLVLTGKRMPPFSLQQLISLGIAPQRQKILVVKAAVAFRAAYEPVAAGIIEVNTPGMTAADPRLLRYSRVRRPIWPVDEFQDL
jgi:microcystin degradation protein MlrC